LIKILVLALIFPNCIISESNLKELENSKNLDNSSYNVLNGIIHDNQLQSDVTSNSLVIQKIFKRSIDSKFSGKSNVVKNKQPSQKKPMNMKIKYGFKKVTSIVKKPVNIIKKIPGKVTGIRKIPIKFPNKIKNEKENKNSNLDNKDTNNLQNVNNQPTKELTLKDKKPKPLNNKKPVMSKIVRKIKTLKKTMKKKLKMKKDKSSNKGNDKNNEGLMKTPDMDNPSSRRNDASPNTPIEGPINDNKNPLNKGPTDGKGNKLTDKLKKPLSKTKMLLKKLAKKLKVKVNRAKEKMNQKLVNILRDC